MSDPKSARQLRWHRRGTGRAAAVIVMLTWYVAGLFLASDRNDPLAKAGGLSKDQQLKITPK
jgi:hypothetical protein